MFEAASDGQLDTVERLIAEGVDVNATSDKDGRTPACVAAQNVSVCMYVSSEMECRTKI